MGQAISKLTIKGYKSIRNLKDFELRNIRTIETGNRNLYLFDFSYLFKKDIDPDGYSYGTACLIVSDRFKSGDEFVNICRRDWTEVMISDKVDMGESLFAQKFLVLSKNPFKAKEIVNYSIQEIMFNHLKKPLINPVSVYISPGGATVLTGRTEKPERLHDLIDLARRIEAAME